MTAPFVIECNTKEESNLINKGLYKFLRYSNKKQKYLFLRRRDTDDSTEPTHLNKPDDFIIECEDAEQANTVNLATHRFEDYDEKKGVYIFCRRGGK